MRVLIALFLTFALVSCSMSCDASSSDVQHALDRLIAHPDREKRFVVVDDLASESFVQFDFENGEIVIDLPVLALTEDQLERAATLFASVGVRRPAVSNDETNADTGEPLTITTYRLGFGRDSAKATAFATRLFQEVYLLPIDAQQLAVTEGE